MAYLDGGKYKGAAADVNVWAPRVSDNQEFSAAQIYVGAATNDQDANTLQAGWIVCSSYHFTIFLFFYFPFNQLTYEQTMCFIKLYHLSPFPCPTGLAQVVGHLAQSHHFIFELYQHLRVKPL